MKAKSLVLLALLCGLSTGCLAEHNSAYSALRNANQDLSESLVQLADKQASCDKSAMVLEPAPLLSAGLSKEELKTVLGYFYLKASIDCSFNEASAVVTHLNALALLQPEGHEDAAKAAQLFTQDLVKLWQAKEQYMTIDAPKRQRIEQAIDLGTPIRMIESAKQLGL